MNETEGTMEKLQILVKAAPEYLVKDPKLGMDYVTEHGPNMKPRVNIK